MLADDVLSLCAFGHAVLLLYYITPHELLSIAMSRLQKHIFCIFSPWSYGHGSVAVFFNFEKSSLFIHNSRESK